jgi:hypothetical protein
MLLPALTTARSGINFTYRPPIETNVTTKAIVNFYSYSSGDLILAYSLAIAFALLANILGGVAFYANGVSHDRSFSAFLSSTRDPALAGIFTSPRLGKLPLPEDVAATPLRFEKMDGEGGLGLKLVEAKLVRPRRGRKLWRGH